MVFTSQHPPLARVPVWVLLILSGLLLGLAYPPNPVWVFGWLGLAPLLCALQRARSYWQAVRWSYVALFIFSAASSWWLGSWQAKADSWLIYTCITVVVLHPFFFMPALLAYYAVLRRRGAMYALILVPFIWSGGEYLHALTDLSYPWLTLGNTQTYNLVYAQFIEFTGVWGLSFMLTAISALVAGIFTLVARPPEERGRVMHRLVVLLVAAIAIPYGYGYIVLGYETPPAATVTVTVVQPNVNPWDKWKTIDTSDQIELNAGLSRHSLQKQPTDMFLWTETAVPQSITEPGNESGMQQMRQQVQSLGVPVLSGFSDFALYPDSVQPPPSARTASFNPVTKQPGQVYYDYYNSAGMFLPDKGLTGTYHKMQLVPFGERIPFVDLAPFLIKMLSWDVGISSWGKGTIVSTFDLPLKHAPYSVKTATAICIESIYPNVVRRFTNSGAEFLTVITNDGWYMFTPGPLQHARFCCLRSIENRRSVARAANTGISCFTDPYGRMIAQSQEGTSTTMTAGIPVRSDLTVYVEYGDWFPQLCLITAALMIVFAASYPDPALLALRGIALKHRAKK